MIDGTMSLHEDPFQLVTLKLYNQLLNSNEGLQSSIPNTKWSYLAVDMVLKEHSHPRNVYLNALASFSEHLHSDHLDWIIGITRKGIKRLGNHDIHEVYLKFISQKCEDYSYQESRIVDQVLQLLITCKEYNVPSSGFDPFVELCQAVYCKNKRLNPLKLEIEEEFYFVNASEKTLEQRIQRKMFILDSENSKSFPFDYLWELFSFSDEDLVKYLLYSLPSMDFYFYSIKTEKITVEFFIEQLANDSILTLQFLTCLRENCSVKNDADLIDFHTLLLLKVEALFDFKVLNGNLEKFITKLKRK